ncbi:MAG: L,D-transpeptidase family protein [Deltaproteobacteria bacterium]|nr:L,D-transpeptidase family protein [Deltaproteobacteria bacterium]
MLVSLLILSAISAPAGGVDFTPLIPVHPAAVTPSDSRGLSLSVLRQAVVVKTADWTAPQGILQRYDRSSPKDIWRPVGEAIPVVVGRNGLGWGIGLHPTVFPEGPEKREGDGRAPAGIFKLSSAFGYAPANQAAWIKLPYIKMTSSIRCVDDDQSPHYNRIVDTSLIKPDWKSDEEMRRADNQYRLGIVIDHNNNPAIPGRGSCIFMHIWKGSDAGTAGCTAMSQENMERLIRWLDPSANPILIQLPEGIYRQFRPVWGFP